MMIVKTILVVAGIFVLLAIYEFWAMTHKIEIEQLMLVEGINEGGDSSYRLVCKDQPDCYWVITPLPKLKEYLEDNIGNILPVRVSIGGKYSILGSSRVPLSLGSEVFSVKKLNASHGNLICNK